MNGIKMKLDGGKTGIAGVLGTYSDPIVNPIGPHGVYDEVKRYAGRLRWLATVIIIWIRGSCASSIPTGRACVQLIGGLYRILLIRL